MISADPAATGAAVDTSTTPTAVASTVNGYATMIQDQYLSVLKTPAGVRAKAELATDASVAANSIVGSDLTDAQTDVNDDIYAGMKVHGATVTATVNSTSTASDGTVTAHVEIDTEVHVDFWGGGSGDSGETDDHALTLKPTGSGSLRIVKDDEAADDTDTDSSTDAIADFGNAIDPAEPTVDDAAQTAVGTALGSTGAADSSADAASSGVKPSKNYPAEDKIDTAKFDAYAVEWTTGKHNGNKKKNFNSKYGWFGATNCANFASQVLDNAGWWMTTGTIFQRANPHKWTFNTSGPGKGATYTWSDAADLYNYAINTGTYRRLGVLDHARSGDLIFVSWDPKGKPDSKIDHVMVVGRMGKHGVPLIFQKSPNRHYKTLAWMVKRAKDEGRYPIRWYALQHVS